jgi:hypothetical protein
VKYLLQQLKMNKLQKIFLCLLVLILTLGFSSCSARLFNKSGGKNAEKKLFSKSIGRKVGLLVISAIQLPSKIKQGLKDRKDNKEYEKSVKLSQKRAFDMQSPEVQARMIQDKINTELHYKEKQKRIKARFKQPESKNMKADLKR